MKSKFQITVHDWELVMLRDAARENREANPKDDKWAIIWVHLDNVIRTRGLEEPSKPR